MSNASQPYGGPVIGQWASVGLPSTWHCVHTGTVKLDCIQGIVTDNSRHLHGVP